MKLLHVGISRVERRIKLGSDEPKIFFKSSKAMGAVLNDYNLKILELIERYSPPSIKALAKLSGRTPTNVSQTLQLFILYDIIEIKREKTCKRPLLRECHFTTGRRSARSANNIGIVEWLY